jgi:hypothetical protein
MTNKQKDFIKAINDLYDKMFHIVGVSMTYIEDEGLRLAHDLYEEMYPDKYTECRKIEKEINEKRIELERIYCGYYEDDECDCECEC